jgi:adenosylcobinamide kinase/adenosylcobinamide-phosphate guanylyltransferase
MSKTLILGGVKSGKSRLAEQWAAASKQTVCYIATATADDTEMQQRISKHQQQRPQHWLVEETPIQLAAAIDKHNKAGQCILVDCLTLWLTNLLLSNESNLVEQEVNALFNTLAELKADIVFVSNETNMGVVPMGELSRRFCDEAGLLHQQIAALCDNVVLTVAGLPHLLKGQIHEQL